MSVLTPPPHSRDRAHFSTPPTPPPPLCSYSSVCRQSSRDLCVDKSVTLSPPPLPPAGFRWPRADWPVAFIPVTHGRETAEGVSRYNSAEAEAVLEVVNGLLAAGMPPGEVCVVSPSPSLPPSLPPFLPLSLSLFLSLSLYIYMHTYIYTYIYIYIYIHTYIHIHI